MDLYRFRSMEYLLGDEYQELQRQTIYFASPDQLNDPMEGFRDIVWSGDKIVWTNFFKHYVFCLHETYLHFSKTKGSIDLNMEDIPIPDRWDKIPTSEGQRLFDDIWRRFLNLPCIPEIIEVLSTTNHKIRYRELGFYFRLLQSVLLDEIVELYITHGVMPESERTPLPEDVSAVQVVLESILTLIMLLEEAYTHEERKIEFENIEAMDNDDRIKNQMNSPISAETSGKNYVLMHFYFPETYLKEVERLLWPKWYAACFMKNYHNSSVWGHYGDKHTGVCLIFETEKAGTLNNFKLYQMIGEDNNPIIPRTTVPFSKVSYADRPGEVDFFKSIGRLTAEELMKLWYTDQEGNISECAVHLLHDNDTYNWREEYWKSFYRDITTKTKDWEYEQEYRLILKDDLDEFSAEKRRSLRYDFNSLKGVIFGIKTTDKDKLRIIEIIQRKCEEYNRANFKFYQAYYSSADGNIRTRGIQLT